MNNNIAISSWKSAFRKGFEKKYIELVIYSYHEVLRMKPHKQPLEDTRRDMLIDQMRKNKSKFGITFNIAAEAGVFDEDYTTKGRIDICCYLSQFEDEYIAFECKRFLKKNLIPSYVQHQYYGEGIKRFEENIYSASVSLGGMIAFLEEGDYSKLYQIMISELPKYTCDHNIEDISENYNYQYILRSFHSRKGNSDIGLFHVLMDFT